MAKINIFRSFFLHSSGPFFANLFKNIFKKIRFYPLSSLNCTPLLDSGALLVAPSGTSTFKTWIPIVCYRSSTTHYYYVVCSLVYNLDDISLFYRPHDREWERSFLNVDEWLFLEVYSSVEHSVKWRQHRSKSASVRRECHKKSRKEALLYIVLVYYIYVVC